jgi:amino acid adenylation domain-containing protein
MASSQMKLADPEGRSMSAGKSKSATISRRLESGPAPLSFGQERRWFLEQMKPNNPPNIARAIRMLGHLDIRLLQQTLDAIVARHEILRTTFGEVNSQGVQLVNESRPVSLSVIDLTSWVPPKREAEIEWLLNEESQRSFSLSEDLLLRASLLRMAPQDQVLILTVHPIAFDNASLILFLEEFAKLYDSPAGGEARLPDLTVQYSDFAQWERSAENISLFEEQVPYWKGKLQGLQTSELPTDRPRPAVQTFCGGRQVSEIADPLYSDLEMFCRREGVTIDLLLLAVLKALIHFYTGSDDIVVGTSCDLRVPELNKLIGCFTGFLTLRTQVGREITGRTLLHRVHGVASDAFAHRDVPFPKVVDDLQPQRDLSRNPLFQVLFSMKEPPPETIKVSGLTLIPLETTSRTAEFDLTLSVRDTEQRLLISWEYNTDLFDDSTISRMMNHYQGLLENLVADPGKQLLDWNYLSAEERHQILVEWNNTPSDYPKDKCIHQLFEAQVARTPDSIALIFDERRLTYQELNSRANQLAHYLRTLGVGPEVRVGICVERSVEMIVGILGILKAGGAYVPLDPAYPRERLAFMLEDSQARVLLTQQRLVADINQHSLRIICLDTDWEQISRGITSDPKPASSSDNLAYVIYTSGSTGKPKGVAIEHRATVAFLSWAISVFSPEKLKGVLASTSVCFDLSVYEIFAPLSCGGSMILTENILHLPSLPAANEVSLVNTIPSAITELLRSKGIPPSVRTINLAGEPLKTALVQQLYELDTVKEVFDLYGPTEDTTYSTFALRSTERATIGRPVSNTQAYILDPHQRLVPIGVSGELHLSGAGLARGYLNRPELTAEKFIRNPFSSVPGARLYRTGDLARYLPNGEIEYLGRLDNQIKIRGLRIELGEIEAVISQNPAVRKTVVIAREDQAGDKRLVAYVALNQGPKARTSELTSELKNSLERKLPAYMLPSAFVELDRLPLTPNGKVDRKALPPPDKTDLQRARFVAPRDEIEFKLTRLWEKVLDTAPIGVTDSFFELGGNSLLAARMFTETTREFGKNLPLATLFREATIEHLATLLRHNQVDERKERWSSLVSIQPDGSKHPFFCVHGVGGNVLTYRALAQYLGPDQPLYGLQSAGLDGNQAPHTTVEAMAAHYIEAICDLQPEGPYFLGGLSFGGIVAFEMARQLQKRGRKVACVALLDSPTEICATGYRLRQRIGGHFDNLLRLSFRARFKYLTQMAKTGKRKIKSRIWRIGYKWYEDTRDQLPPVLRNTKEINYQAAREYVLQSYRGRVALFRASDRSSLDREDELLGWDKFASEVDLYRVPGDHVNMVNEPNVRVLAEKLKQCLDGAAPQGNGADPVKKRAGAVA